MDRLNKIFILSRFSVGAEIAINGVIINSLCTNCPTAEIFLVGPEKNGILFKNIPQVNLLVCDYPKKGSLFDRFNAWLNLLEIIEVNTKHLNQEEYLIIDADSRLTQLGLLPVIKNEERYLFFDSRSYHEHSHATLGELTGSWLTKGLGIQAKPSKISIPQESKIYSSFICENLVEDSPIIAISYGTGNNSLKQLPFEIEFNLVLELLKGSSGTILLLSGIQPVELEQKNKLFSLLTSKEYINGINISGNKIDAITKYKKSRLIAWDGPLAEYCALISIADYHIGYDSSGQHIAAALGIPTVDIFVDPTNTESFINRWTPTSSARVEVLRLPQNNNVDTTVQLIIDAWKRLSLF